MSINPAAGDAPAPAVPAATPAAAPADKDESAANGTTAPAAESEPKPGEDAGNWYILLVNIKLLKLL